MKENDRIAKELLKIARNIVSADEDDDEEDELMEMTDEIAEENNVVAGDVCCHCAYFESIYMGEGRGKCSLLNCLTFTTDVCKNYRKR